MRRDLKTQRVFANKPGALTPKQQAVRRKHVKACRPIDALARQLRQESIARAALQEAAPARQPGPEAS